MADCRCLQVFQGTRVWYHPDWQADLEELGLANMDNWRVPVDVPAVSKSKHVIACYRITLASGRVIYYKRYDYRTRWKAALRFWLRRATPIALCAAGMGGAQEGCRTRPPRWSSTG